MKIPPCCILLFGLVFFLWTNQLSYPTTYSTEDLKIINYLVGWLLSQVTAHITPSQEGTFKILLQLKENTPYNSGTVTILH